MPWISRTIPVVAVLVLVASACTSAAEPVSSIREESAAEASQGDTSRTEGEADSGVPRGEREDVPSALRGDRLAPSFPDPVVDPSDIQRGGPAPDGIPPIDDPIFLSVQETDYLTDDEAVIVVQVAGEAKAYPVQILIWHEIVNDTVGGVPVTITYCPLCNSALAFDRRLDGRILDFGTSGELYQSALVMYDRQTESLWAHFTGESIVGHLAGSQLDLVDAQTLSYRTFAEQFPDGQVLTKETGVSRSYGLNPYAGYDDASTDPIGDFISQPIDDRLAAKERIVGVLDIGGAAAVTLADLAALGVLHLDNLDSDDGAGVVLFHEMGLASALDDSQIAEGRDVGQTGAFLALDSDGDALTFERVDGTFQDTQTHTTWSITGVAIAGPLMGQWLDPVPHLDTFWFAWSTYRPDAVLVRPS